MTAAAPGDSGFGPVDSPYVVVLVGDIDLAVSPVLIGHLCDCALNGATDVAVDLSEVTFFGSTGLNFLVRLRRLVQPRGGAVTLIGPSPLTAKLLQLDGFAEGFRFEPRR